MQLVAKKAINGKLLLSRLVPEKDEREVKRNEYPKGGANFPNFPRVREGRLPQG
jgi:hypothetical protein